MRAAGGVGPYGLESFRAGPATGWVSAPTVARERRTRLPWLAPAARRGESWRAAPERGLCRVGSAAPLRHFVTPLPDAYARQGCGPPRVSAPTVWGIIPLCFPPHPSSGLRETPDATFPSRGRLWIRAVFGFPSRALCPLRVEAVASATDEVVYVQHQVLCATVYYGGRVHRSQAAEGVGPYDVSVVGASAPTVDQPPLGVLMTSVSTGCQSPTWVAGTLAASALSPASSLTVGRK